jgi:transcriptional regulator with XRE-family HTH domain
VRNPERKKNIYTEEQAYLVKKLKEARIEAGFDQKTVAEKLDRSQSYMSKVESGQLRIDVIELKKFSNIYKKDINFFLKN